MKKIVILTNDNGREKVIGENNYDLIVNKKFNDIHVVVLPDNSNLNDIREVCGIETPPDFLAYHNNGNKDFISHEYLKHCLKKGFSHDKNYTYPDDFYNVVLTKVYESQDILLKDIECYFQSKLEHMLDNLHTDWAEINFNAESSKDAIKSLEKKGSEELKSLLK